MSNLLLESDVHQQFIPFDIHDVAEGALSSTGEVQANPAVSDAQIAEIEVVEPIRKFGIYNVQFLARSAGPYSEDAVEHQEHRSRSPRLGRARDWIMHRIVKVAPLDAAKQFG
jgi:hypothetical protein